MNRCANIRSFQSSAGHTDFRARATRAIPRNARTRRSEQWTHSLPRSIGVSTAQDRDTAEPGAESCARPTSIALQERSCKAQQAALAVALANRKQVAVTASESRHPLAPSAAGESRCTDASRHSARLHQNYSPLDGIVSVRVAIQGEMVAQGGPIVVVVDVDHLLGARRRRRNATSTRSASVKPLRDKDYVPGDIVEGKVFFEGAGKRLRHAARRQPHQARY